MGISGSAIQEIFQSLFDAIRFPALNRLNRFGFAQY